VQSAPINLKTLINRKNKQVEQKSRSPVREAASLFSSYQFSIAQRHMAGLFLG
jgi:hypothetical protein